MKHFFILLILSLLSPFLQAQNIDRIIEKQANSLLKNKEISSVSIGVYKDGQQYIHHFGELEKGTNNPPTDNTLYEIASVTKTFTGYLTAKAVLENKIKLEDDIRNYLEGEFPNLEFEGKPITIRNLVTHTSGLPHFMSEEMSKVFEELLPEAPNQVYKLEEDMTKKKFFEALYQFHLTSTPGSKYSYSNAGAEIMGFILTSIYHKTIDELLKESFLEKTGMNNTAIRLTETQKANLSQGYWLNNEWLSPNQINPLWATGSGIKATMPDLMKYIELNLRNDDPVVTESHKELYKEGKTLWVSYFWRLFKDKHGTSYNHHGATTGTQNWLYIYPKYNFGISIIVNQSGLKTPGKLSQAAQKILKEVIK